MHLSSFFSYEHSCLLLSWRQVWNLPPYASIYWNNQRKKKSPWLNEWTILNTNFHSTGIWTIVKYVHNIIIEKTSPWRKNEQYRKQTLVNGNIGLYIDYLKKKSTFLTQKRACMVCLSSICLTCRPINWKWKNCNKPKLSYTFFSNQIKPNLTEFDILFPKRAYLHATIL